MNPHSKAGQMFICVCCKDHADEHEASFDPQFNGPICEECRVRIIKALAWMKPWGIDHPVAKIHINPSNAARFQIL